MIESFTLRFIQTHPADAARMLEALDASSLVRLMMALPPAAAATVLGHMSPDARSSCIRSMGDAAAPVVEHLPVAVAVPALRALDAAACRRLLRALPKLVSVPMGLALRYPEGTVGALLDPQAATVHRDMTLKETVQIARRAPELLRRYVYVLGERQELVGVLDVRECLLGSRSAPVRDLMHPGPVFLRASTSIAEAAADAAWSRFDVLPVVGRSRVFNGVLRRRVLEAAREAGRGAKGPAASLPGAVMDLANLYWQASTVLFLGGGESTGKARDR